MAPVQPMNNMPPPGLYGPGAGYNEKPVYRPFGAVYQGQDQPPPPGGAPNSVGLVQAGPPPEQPKKNRFGGRLGETVS